MLAIIASLAAFFVKGLAGFANTLVFTTILGFGSSNLQITPMELVLGFPCNIYVAWHERKKISVKKILPIAAMVMVGSIPGAFFLKNLDVKLLKILFGILVVIIGIDMLVKNGRKSKNDSKVLTTLLGLAAGILCGLFGVGVLVAAYINRTSDNPDEFKGTVSAVFAVENIFRIVLYACTGILSFDILLGALKLVPFMIIGLAAGLICSGKMKESLVKKIVIILLIIAGIALIIKA
ncbi:MAG: sulfite exporter TauE/SafE family protein [Oscillospiraceae bacterium]|nr:sulfite exporter TauE/SafE family protein [Oscillospiraceae bacterium]